MSKIQASITIADNSYAFMPPGLLTVSVLLRQAQPSDYLEPY